MKKIIFTSLCFAAIFVGFNTTASAHVLKTDGDMGIILHINPDDSPISGSPTQYILYFDDYTGRFSLPACNCNIGIKEGNQTIHSNPATITNSSTSEDTFTFPKADVYTLVVSGTPKHVNAFQTFTVSYLVRVGGVNNQKFPVLLWIGMTLLCGLILLGAYATEHNTNDQNKRSKR